MKMEKIHTYRKWDVIYVLMFLALASLYIYGLSSFFEEPPQKTIYEVLVFDLDDPIGFILQLLFYISFIVGTLIALNFGFRIFEYTDYGFCMRSMFSRRCYKWEDIEEIYASTKFGASWVFITTRDGNFYYCSYNSKVLEVLKKKTGKKVTVVYDPYTISPALRKRRREHGQRMMFFQP